MKKKLFLFTSTFPYGSQETFLESEIKYLQDNFDVTIFPRKAYGEIRESYKTIKLVSRLFGDYSLKRKYNKKYAYLNAVFYQLLLKNLRHLKSLEAIKRIAAFASEYAQTKQFTQDNRQLFEGDDIVCYSYWLNGVGYGLSDFFYTKDNVKVISRAHRYDVYDNLYSPEFMPSRSHYLSLIDKVFCISEDGKEFIANKYKNQSKLTVSKLGTYKHYSLSLTKERDKSIVKVISVSNLYPVKRVDKIAESLNYYCNKRKSISLEWHHYGDGGELEKVQVIQKQSPKNLKVFLHARVSNNTIHEVLAEGAFNCFINLSLSEGIPVSIMEAISYGIPILATDVGGVSEIVKQEVGELLEVDFSKEDFVTSLDTVLERLEFNQDSRRKIQSFWSTNFSADENYQQFVEEIKQIFPERTEKID